MAAKLANDRGSNAAEPEHSSKSSTPSTLQYLTSESASLVRYCETCHAMHCAVYVSSQKGHDYVVLHMWLTQHPMTD